MVFFVFARRQPHRFVKLAGPLLSFWTIMALLVAGELVAQVALRPRIVSRKAFLYPPGSRYAFEIDDKIAPGLHGPGRFSINEQGLRGPSAGQAQDAYRIIAVGGSATECMYLDDSEAWPDVLMQYLNGAGARKVWVATAAVAGHTTVHHLKVVRSLPALRQADLLLFMTGVNDLVTTMNHEGAPTGLFLRQAASEFLETSWLNGRVLRMQGILDRTMLYQLIRLALGEPEQALRMDAAGNFYRSRRLERAGAPLVPMPPLETGLAEYRGRIADLARECRNLRVRYLWVTQPSIWRDGLEPAVQRLIWFGGVGEGARRKGFTSIPDLARAMDRYNAALLEVCREMGLECFDLAAKTPKDTSVFFDDCHFNESGARRVARELADYLLSRGVLSRGAR